MPRCIAAGLALASFWIIWGVGIGAGPSTLDEEKPPAAAKQSDLAKLPLYFVENQGQIDPRVSYYTERQGFGVYFGRDGVTYSFSSPSEQEAGSESLVRPASLKAEAETARRWAVKMELVGARPGVEPIGQDPTPTVVSYFKGQRSEWKTGLSTYGGILYRDVWPGIDLAYGTKGNELKYEFVVRPGARPEQIQLTYSGATAVGVDAEGRLEVSTPLGDLVDEAPYTYQEADGRRVDVSAAYAMKQGHSYGFLVGEYDPSLPLVIDPRVLYARLPGRFE